MSDRATPQSQTAPLTSAWSVVRAGMGLIARFVREQPVIYTLAAAGAVAFTAAIVASAVVVGWITDEVVVPVLAEGAPVEGRLRTAVLLIAGVAVWKAAGIVVRRTAATRLQAAAQARLRTRLIEHLLGLSLRWYRRRGVGDLLSVSDVDARQATFVLAPLPFATGVLALLLGASAMITVTDPLLGGLGMLLLAVVVGLDLRGSWLTFAAMEEAQRRRGRVAEVAHESFDGALTVKALGRGDLETDRFAVAAFSLRDQLVRVGRVWTGYRALTEGLPAIGIVVLLVVGTARIAGGQLTPGELVRVAYLLSLLAVPIRLIGYLMWDLAHSTAGWRRVEAVLSADDQVVHGDVASLPDGSGAAVEVRRVGFSYDGGPPALTDVHLRIPPGRTVAVVGPTAAGKSTLALLLARLWDPDDGSIRLDGRDLRELSPGALPAEVSYVSQDTFLFDDTVAGNITLHLDIPAEDVARALRLAGAAGFVAELPDGLGTRLGERGATLSGGQQQRIALARALVRRPRLLILDDATSAVDPSVEAAILRGLKAADLPSTVVVVAYRRATIVLADEVVYVDEGRIVAHGTHERLLAEVPGYARLLEAYDVDAAARAMEAAAAEGLRHHPPTSGRGGYGHPDGWEGGP